MNTQMTKLSLIVLSLTMVLAAAAGAAVLHDQSEYDFSGPGFFNVIAGAPPMGVTTYSVNDIVVDGTGWVITSISTYQNALGGFENDVTQAVINIFPKTGELPVEIPTNDTMVPVTVTHISGDDYKVTADGLNIELAPGEYWIGLTHYGSAFNSGIHMPAATLMGDATPSYDTGGFPMPMWAFWVPATDAAILILGDDNVVATDETTLDSVKSYYR